MPREATLPPRVINVPGDYFSMAGFEVTLYGRFWVTPEDTSESSDEVEVIARLIDELLARGTTWTNKKGETVPLEIKDILVIAPYNAQVALLAKRLPKARIGTVDKFQGQQAPIVFYSMATSSPEDAPRGMEFLYSANRLNVATSRAQCVTVLVANPALFDVQCKTPRQMELANSFCRYLEMASTVTMS